MVETATDFRPGDEPNPVAKPAAGADRADRVLVYVEEPDRKMEDSTRREIIQAGMDVWNRVAGNSLLMFTDDPKIADVRVREGRFPGAVHADGTPVGAAFAAGSGEIRLVDDPNDERAWSANVAAHELGHALGLSHMGGGLMENIDKAPTQADLDELRKGHRLVSEGQAAVSLVKDRFLIPISEEMEGQIRSLVGEGRWDIAAVQEWAREQASGLYPSFAQQIARVDPAVLLDPYREVARQELERDVSYDDPVFRDAVASLGEDGQPPLASLAAFRSYVRGLPEWDETSGAERQANRLMDFLSVGGPVSEENI